MSSRQLFEICPDCNGNGFIAHMAANPTLDETIEECTRCEDWKGMVPVEPEHQHQWLPWLTLPNGSSWTQCTGCGEQFQYDH